MSYSMPQHLAYNIWAGDRLAKTLEPVDNITFFQELPNSFGSIAKTLRHIYDAQLIWLKRLQGASYTALSTETQELQKTDLIEV